MNDELERCGRKQLWPNLRYYPGIFVEGLRKTTNILSQGIWSPGQDLNQDLNLPNTQPGHSVFAS
jgi:hypothetical protein